MTTRDIDVEINGRHYRATVEPRLLLSDFIRHEAGLTGTHVGCEHGVCGACTIEFDGEPARACLLFSVQADGHRVRTVEGLTDGLPEGSLDPLQQAFHEQHALQCGFCTPGILLSLQPLLREGRELSDDEIRSALAGNLCRCTGYANIVAAVRTALHRSRAAQAITAADL
ncbi:(2Fe-2S)-binding protein [Streptomyces sp. NPDC002896]|uniref:(2Fe-2S)-binding protein n=1 Tax=Streptomyces sp. NPDC002896 TaxID=3154438 RepID=UPI00332CD879